jgi:hypothetical protein
LIVYAAQQAAQRDQRNAGRINERYKGSGHNTPADAIRHADWSCRLTVELGPAVAETATDAHEGEPKNPRERQTPNKVRMDQWNNRVGRELAGGVLNADACFDRALMADQQGWLITNPEHPEW